MNIFKKLLQIGIKNSDSKALRDKKILLMYLAILMSCGGLLWGIMCLYFRLYIPALVPFTYVILSIINVVIFYYTKSRKSASRFQVVISLLLPFIFQYMLGGILASGAVMLWATLSFIAALTFQKVKTASVWMLCYVLFVVISAYTNEYALSIKPDIMPQFAIAFFAINLSVIPTISFLIVIYFRKRHETSEKILELNIQKLAKANLINKSINGKLHESYGKMKKASVVLKAKYDELEKLKMELIIMTNKQSDIILSQIKPIKSLN